jgi:hypothetical protein
VNGTKRAQIRRDTAASTAIANEISQLSIKLPRRKNATIRRGKLKMPSDELQIEVRSALAVSRILWPEFVEEHGCVLLSWHAGSNPPPASDTATSWESFVNHTHVFDEFANNATTAGSEGALYDEHHPDFVSACELGQKIAKLWALKLKLDFPNVRFRVYYTQYDNPIVRFHRVRDDEEPWLSDEALHGAVDRSFRSALVYDTSRLHLTSWEHSNAIH